MPDDPVAVVILSTKSSGSTALLTALEAAVGARTLAWSPHQEHETLFWTKAASALDLPQWDMPDSVVPYPPEVARSLLRDLVTYNLDDAPTAARVDEAWVADAWERLTVAHGPVFVEKSPHHLAQRSCLDLLVATARSSRHRHVLVLLQRDPLAVLLSMWNRWSYVPRAHEREVIESARNQAWLARQSGLECVTVRYEHLVEDTTHLASLLGTVDATGLESLRDGRPVTSPDWSPGWTPSPELAAAREGLGYGAIPTPVAPAAARATWLARSSTRAAIAGARRRVGRLRTAGRDA